MLQKKNAMHPFEGGEMESSLEFVVQRNDASLAVLAVHSKKRPNSLVIARMFDHHVLDMVELSIVRFESIKQLNSKTCAVGLKPAFVFSGELFEQRREYKLLQNMLLDFYRGHVVEAVNLAGLESVVSVTATPACVMFRVYRVLLKQSDSPTPAVELELMGPAIDWVVGRTRFASDELMRQALRQPKELRPTKTKNISKNPLGDTLGRVHVGQQKLDQIQTRKLKGLNKNRVPPAAAPRPKSSTKGQNKGNGKGKGNRPRERSAEEQ